MRRVNFVLILFAALCFSIASPARAQADATFAKANAEFAAGNFAGAISGYESLVKQHRWNASLFYDLGNAYFRTGDLGRAILNYERALALDPAQPEARANLQLVRDQARALELKSGWIEERLGFLTPAQYTWLGAIAFWIAVGILCGLYFSQRRPVVWIFAFVLSAAFAVGAGLVLWKLETGRGGRDLAIITRKQIQARLATAESAGTVLVLPPGSEIKILSTRGDWVYADLPNDLQGWIPAASAERVRL